MKKVYEEDKQQKYFLKYQKLSIIFIISYRKITKKGTLATYNVIR